MYYVNYDFSHAVLVQYKLKFSSLCPVHNCSISCRLCMHMINLHMRFHMSKPHEANCSLCIFLLVALVSKELSNSHTTCVHHTCACVVMEYG